MRITILFLLVSFCSFGQSGSITLTPNVINSDGIYYSLISGDKTTEEISQSGRKYLLSWKGSEYPTIIYFSGSGQIGRPLDALKGTAFFKLFYLANSDKYNFILPMQYAGLSGWENRIGGKNAAGLFILEIIQRHEIKKIVCTGHSSGGAWDIVSDLQTVISGWAPVAGRALNYQGAVLMGKNKIPVKAFHGDKDTTYPNSYVEGLKAVKAYKTGGGITEMVVFKGVGHGSDSYAYRYDSGFKEWIDSLFPEEPKEPGLYLDGKFCGTDSCRVGNSLITIIR